MADNNKHVFRAQDVNQPSMTRQDGKTVFRAAAKPQPVRERKEKRKAVRPEKTAEPRRKQKPGFDSQSAPKRKKQTGTKLPVIIVLVVIVLLAAGLVLWAVFAKDKLPQKQESGTSAPAVQTESPKDGEWPAQVGDRLIDAKPEKLVSLSPMITRVLLSLPGHEVLQGVTEYCDTGDLNIKTVGTPLLPHPDEIAAMGANYVLCQTPVTDGVKEQIEQSGARVILMNTPSDLDSLREFYGQLGAALLGNNTGRKIGTSVIDRLENNLEKYKAATGGRYTALLLPDLSGMAATEDTAEWSLLGQVFRHPMPGETNWLCQTESLNDEDAENDLEKVKAADPDVLFLPADADPEQVSALLGDMRAVKENMVVYYDRQMMESLSPMLIFDVAKAAQLVCPEGAYQPKIPEK